MGMSAIGNHGALRVRSSREYMGACRVASSPCQPLADLIRRRGKHSGLSAACHSAPFCAARGWCCFGGSRADKKS
jgi:hypothetical protein